jgi:hypothetical protein
MSSRKLKQQLKKGVAPKATAMAGVTKGGIPVVKRWEKKKAAKATMKAAKKAGAFLARSIS